MCYCAHLPQLESKTRVVFLQHPRERRVAIGTARMAHLALRNSELHQGVDFTGHARVQALAARPERVAVLFPGEGARTPAEWRDSPPETLIVVDGTWPNARKVVARNPLLSALPRIAFAPRRPSNYRIRAEPAEHCVSTIEAVVEILGALEGEQERYDTMLRAFERMVDTQLECQAQRLSPPRRRVHRPALRLHPELVAYAERFGKLVLLYAEANGHALNVGVPPELAHLVALRLSTGERIEAVLAPRKPLGPNTALHLEVSEAELLGGEPVASALGRLARFLHPDDVLGVWSPFSLDLLRAEGPLPWPALDLRRLRSQVFKQRAGGVEDAARSAQPGPLALWGRGRAGRRIAALEVVARTLLAQASSPPVRLRRASS